MEEIKTKKKLNKKPLIICLVLALVFGIVGFVDIKSNAAESYTVNVSYDRTTGNEILDKTVRTFRSSSPMQVYIYCSHYEPAILTEKIWGYAYVVSDSSIDSVAGQNCVQFEKNGRVFYVLTLNMSSGPYGESSGQKNQYYEVYSDSGNDIFVNTQYATSYDFAQAYINDSLDVKIDYDNLPTDFEMPVIENIKVNRIKNWVSSGLYNQYFDYVSWSGNNNYKVQVKKTFSVYFIRKVDFEDRFLGAEYNRSTMQDEILEIGSSSFTQQTDMQYISDYRQDDFEFYSNIRKNTDIENWDKSEICFCYAIRFVDVENNKAGPWCYVLPSQNIGDFEQTFTCSFELEDGSFTENFSPSGTNESFKDFDEIGGIDNAKDTIDLENEFKDKYEIVDGNADTQEVMNWLNTVVSFIKGTPNIVTSVLSFLPQPILYGMYITIFLGCIASALAIIKALI